MIPEEKRAAQMLEGMTLPGGWKVISKHKKPHHQTGGVYSSCYLVQKGELKGFLKAFDFSGAEKVGSEAIHQIQDILNAFSLERDILEICSKTRCRNVIELLHTGDIEVKDAEKYPRVDYLILEFADKGDIRDAMEEKRANTLFKIKSLHQLAKGLSQIHAQQIAHQDIKPSNVVTTREDVTKLSDFGSAIRLILPDDSLPYHLKKPYAGSWEYAPPELLYGNVNADNIIRRIGCDLYLLGSMIVFYFVETSMTALIRANLEEKFCWTNNSTFGRFDEIKAYLIQAYERALNDLSERIEDKVLRETLTLVVRYLCHPDPHKRGHQKNIQQLGPNYGLNRIVQLFDHARLRVEVKNL